MGYDIHITRREFWAIDGPDISHDEWKLYVERDPEIERDERNQDVDYLFVAHPGGAVPLWWSEGDIATKNPDKATVAKFIAIATALGASVQGDDGEVYTDTSAIPD